MLGKPFKPNNEMYAQLEEAGRLFILTARRDGVMVGYIVYIVCHHPHCTDLLCAYEEHYFLHQSARGGRNGLNLISQSLNMLRERGVDRAFISTPPGVKNQGRLLEHIGFEHSGDIHSISLGDA